MLPNLESKKSYGNDLVQIVPFDDPILKNLTSRFGNIKKMLSSFTNEFGVHAKPSVLVYTKDAPEVTGNDVDVMASFRDVLAIASVTKGWTRILGMDSQHSVMYSDIFEFYPWRLDKDNKDLLATTPAITGMHLVREFHGQISPAIPARKLETNNVDEPLYEALLLAWWRKFVDQRGGKQDNAIFRSLRMACSASKVPGGTDSTHLDYGRQIALWVSAFEILAHPINNHASAQEVCQVLRNTPWIESALRNNDHYWPENKKRDPKISWPEWLYRHLNRLRNDYVHGNEIEENSLFIMNTGRCYHQFAPSLYRAALSSILGMRWAEKRFDPERPEEWEGYHQYQDETRMLRMEQSFNEDAILASKTPRSRKKRGR